MPKSFGQSHLEIFITLFLGALMSSNLSVSIAAAEVSAIAFIYLLAPVAFSCIYILAALNCELQVETQTLNHLSFAFIPIVSREFACVAFAAAQQQLSCSQQPTTGRLTPASTMRVIHA